MRLPAAFQALPGESFFETLPTEIMLVPEEKRDCDKPYSGSFGSFGVTQQEAGEGCKSFCGLGGLADQSDASLLARSTQTIS